MLDAELLERVLPKVGGMCTMLLERVRRGDALSPSELRSVVTEAELASLREAEEVAAELRKWVSGVHLVARDLKSVADLFRVGPAEPTDAHVLLEQSWRFVSQELFGGPGVVNDLAADSAMVFAPRAQLAEVFCTLCTLVARSARATKTPIRLCTRSDGRQLHVEWRAEGPSDVSFARQDGAPATSMETVRQLGGHLTVETDEESTTFQLVLPLMG